ncbi:MAG: hypothetical protein R3B89_16965 [Polyangiaceae bacterium]
MRMLRLALLTSCASVLALGVGCTAEFTSAETGGTGGVGGSAGGETGGTGGVGGAAGTGGAGGTGGVASAGGSGGTGGSCNGAATPSDDSCVVTEDYGVFVSPKGDDSTADGSRGAPYATLEAGLAAAYAAGKRVYACSSEGEYEPNGQLLVIDDSLSGTQLYGGLDCDTWAYDATKPTEVVGDYAALYVNEVKGGLRIEDFSFRAVDQTQNSSIGALVKDSQGVLFKRVTFIAGKGADGEPGTDGLAGDPGPAPSDGQRGTAGTCSSPADVQLGGFWSNPSSCGAKGGAGGTARKGEVGEVGRAGTPNTHVTPVGGNANGGPVGANGGDGANGDSGENGGTAVGVGTFHGDGFDPSRAPDGADGFVGQGGGGGGSGDSASGCIASSGGAGGMGGCGGTHGGGGEGGHASVALISWRSAVTLTNCHLESGAGGAGGAGGDGALGGDGGTGAQGAGGVSPGGAGGRGGRGGNGGSGAGGVGGPSYGLVYGGTKPAETNSCTFSVGSGGPGGEGGKLGGSVNPAPDGPSGASAEMYEQT